MKAVRIDAYGGNDVLRLLDETPRPEPGAGQVLVEVRAAALNPVDRAIRAGYMQAYMPMTLPATLGGDFAGIVRDVGEGVTDLKVGDEVYGSAMQGVGGSGSLAQFAVASAGNTARIPRGLSFEEAASMPLAGVSALQGIEEYMELRPGQKLLIQGGAGGVGTFAIQIAKNLGGYVAATVSADDKDYVKGSAPTWRSITGTSPSRTS